MEVQRRRDIFCCFGRRNINQVPRPRPRRIDSSRELQSVMLDRYTTLDRSDLINELKVKHGVIKSLNSEVLYEEIKKWPGLKKIDGEDLDDLIKILSKYNVSSDEISGIINLRNETVNKANQLQIEANELSIRANKVAKKSKDLFNKVSVVLEQDTQ